MIIKWTVCSVPVSERRVFSYRQRDWKRMARIKGFLGRIGGWNIKNPLEACTLTFFQDMDAYQLFVDRGHSDLIRLSESAERFSIIDSQVYQKENDIFGLSHEQVYASIADCGHLLKIGDCQVREEKKEDFLLMQCSVWNLGMANAPGMTTGLFAESVQDATRYLILTRWKSRGEYQAYEEHVLPKLLNWAYDDQVEEQFQGRLIRLVEDWCFEYSTITFK